MEGTCITYNTYKNLVQNILIPSEYRYQKIDFSSKNIEHKKKIGIIYKSYGFKFVQNN
jgi:hypothetical protein